VSKSAQKQSKKSEFVPKKFAKIVAKISSAKEAKKTRSAVATAEKVQKPEVKPAPQSAKKRD